LLTKNDDSAEGKRFARKKSLKTTRGGLKGLDKQPARRKRGEVKSGATEESGERTDKTYAPLTDIAGRYINIVGKKGRVGGKNHWANHKQARQGKVIKRIDARTNEPALEILGEDEASRGKQ